MEPPAVELPERQRLEALRRFEVMHRHPVAGNRLAASDVGGLGQHMHFGGRQFCKVIGQSHGPSRVVLVGDRPDQVQRERAAPVVVASAPGEVRAGPQADRPVRAPVR